MDATRITIIIGMGLVTYLIRVLPQLFFVGQSFPESFERYLRYLAYALVAGIVSISLFLAGPRFEAAAAPARALALIVAVLLASWTKSPLMGMVVGTLVATVLPWLMGR
jgi:branched-subunit amino acid transport protein